LSARAALTIIRCSIYILSTKPNVITRWINWCLCKLRFYLLVAISSYFLKKLTNIRTIFCTDLKKCHTIRFGQFLSWFILNFSILSEIHFAANQKDTHLWAWKFMDLFDPILHVLKRNSILYGINENDDHRPFVIRSRNIFKFLLTSSIPYLKLDLVLLNLHSLDLEINSYGGYIIGLKGIIAVSQQNVGFTNSAVSYYSCFNHIIAVAFLFRFHASEYY